VSEKKYQEINRCPHSNELETVEKTPAKTAYSGLINVRASIVLSLNDDEQIKNPILVHWQFLSQSNGRRLGAAFEK
jgi:hypothetical protein